MRVLPSVDRHRAYDKCLRCEHLTYPWAARSTASRTLSCVLSNCRRSAAISATAARLSFATSARSFSSSILSASYFLTSIDRRQQPFNKARTPQQYGRDFGRERRGKLLCCRRNTPVLPVPSKLLAASAPLLPPPQLHRARTFLQQRTPFPRGVSTHASDPELW